MTDYTTLIGRIQYQPSGEAPPPIKKLCDTKKYEQLISAIESAEIPDDVKDFLRLAAARHIVFNYKHIAEFYVFQEPEVQRLMEQSALVILDIDSAIKNGYVKLCKTLEEIINEDT